MLDRVGVGPLVVNRGHPLNRGRNFWWLALPGTNYGGARWYDLMGSNHGTISGASPTYGWRATSRPGGYGQVLTDGTVRVRNDAVGPPTLVTGQAHSSAIWCLFGNTSSSPQTVAGYGNGSAGINLALRSSSVGAYNVSGGGTMVQAAAPAPSTWHRLLLTFDGGTMLLYLDGAQAGSTLTVGETATVTRVAAMENDNTSFPERMASGGAVDDFSLWTRRLSAAEAAADYDLSRRGYPGVLARAGWPAATPAAAAGPAFRPYFASNRPAIGSGIY